MPGSPEQQRRSDRDTGDIASHGDARVARLVKVADHIESHADEPLTLARLATQHSSLVGVVDREGPCGCASDMV